MDSLNDGVLHGKRWFTCPRGRAVFVRLSECKPDVRFGCSTSAQDSTYILHPLLFMRYPTLSLVLCAIRLYLLFYALSDFISCFMRYPTLSLVLCAIRLYLLFYALSDFISCFMRYPTLSLVLRAIRLYTDHDIVWS